MRIKRTMIINLDIMVVSVGVIVPPSVEAVVLRAATPQGSYISLRVSLVDPFK